MRKTFIILLFALPFILFSCKSGGSLKSKALEYLPDRLSQEVSEQLGISEQPLISDITPLYDCDSLCILQMKVKVQTDDGGIQEFAARYIFLKDSFMSAAVGHPVYEDAVRGAPWLDKEEIRKFCKETTKGGDRVYSLYVAIANPIVH